MPRIYPSLMAADPLNLGAIIAMLDLHCRGYHLDIMDGHYVPNLAFNPSTINAITQITKHHLWVHWMVENPLQFFTYFNLPKQSLMSFHIEKNQNIEKCLKAAKENNFKVGIALCPKTPIAETLTFLDVPVDDVLIMAVEPGFSGQKFIPEIREKIRRLATYRQHKNLSFTISVDGGVDHTNLPSLINDGADIIAIGSALFSSNDSAQELCSLNTLIHTLRT